ncbi:MAG: DUF924 family protein [Sphingomicrobium sp.]
MTVHLSRDTAPAEAAAIIVDFWFNEVGKVHWFAPRAALDRIIAERFSVLRDAVLAQGAEGWRDDPQTSLTAVIMLDQFSRNIHRGSARAFEADPLARQLTFLALSRGWDQGMTADRRQFLLMPLMHSENLADQERSLDEFAKLDDETLRFARLHHDQIARFGRFPGRNPALGRESTAEEQELIDSGRTF